MSLATFKKKTQAKYHNNSVNEVQFSTVGAYRNQGRVGQSTQSRSLTGPNSNGSQFFIMHVDYPLPYSYAIFGKVVDGLDVIDKIASVETGAADKPVEDVVIETVEISES